MNLPKRYLGEDALTWLTVVFLKHKTRIWKTINYDDYIENYNYISVQTNWW